MPRRFLLEILRADLVKEFAEFLDFAFLVVALDQDGGLREDALLREDRGVGADREGDGVAGAAGDREPGAVLAQLDGGVEGAFLELGDHHPLDRDEQLVEQVLEQVVGERPRGGDALEGEGDRGRLDVAYPDCQEAFAVALLEQHDGCLGGELDADTNEGELDHRATPSTVEQRCARVGRLSLRGYQTLPTGATRPALAQRSFSELVEPGWDRGAAPQDRRRGGSRRGPVRARPDPGRNRTGTRQGRRGGRRRAAPRPLGGTAGRAGCRPVGWPAPARPGS